ncbi:minichromosome maintenance domain-containing protein 2 isoform X2 [Xenopus laevis]|uniref:Minichromosome maintenance domain-containing protein 2 isoform X2 n=1 Tax=Xenopus laevis TaxID=8355 RepID=A0A8J1KYI8_XENLA|nr:minichromosome maintenance domain-containing protein 2 isoform X2 [Xenopus laevis]
MSWAPSVCRTREAALVYMDRSGGLQKFTEDCKRYNESNHSYAVYRFVISINPTDITELDATLGNYILHEPMRAAQIFQSVCDTAIKTLSLIESYQKESQINVVLRLTHLPDLPAYHLNLDEFPMNYKSQRLCMLKGVVIAMSTVTKYTQGARFLCSEKNCPFSEGFRYIRVHIPGATESATIRTDFVCSLCSSLLREDMKYRVLGEKQVVELLDSRALQIFQGHSTNIGYCELKSYAVFVRDELINKMKIGARYRVVGIPVCGPNGPHISVCIEANNIHQYIEESPSAISKPFQSLLSVAMSSPWIFTGILANMFASQVIPIGVYNTLKLCILLSLVQTGKDDEGSGSFLDLLAVTSDALVVDRLMSYSICLVPRGVRHSASNDLFATVMKDIRGSGAASIQAGSALMARGGICFTGDLRLHKKDKLDHLQSVLESRSTSVFIPGKKYGEDVNHQDISVVPSNLLDAFGMFIYCDETSDKHSSLSLVHHNLQRAVSPETCIYPASQLYTTQDYERLIAFAKNIQVNMSKKSETLIHGYYLASRRVRTDTHGSTMPASALRHLMSMSEAHAKLSLRREVLEEDVLIAVLLFELSLTLKHGSSVFYVPPSALFPVKLYDESSLHQRDMYLSETYQQLQRFVFTYGPGTTVSASEE